MKKTGGKLSRFTLYLALCLISFASVVPLLWQVRSSCMPIHDIFQIPMIVVPKRFEFGNYAYTFV